MSDDDVVRALDDAREAARTLRFALDDLDVALARLRQLRQDERQAAQDPRLIVEVGPCDRPLVRR